MTKKRVRGFAPYQPRAKARQLIEQIESVLAELIDVLPITIRQLFYRLVAVHKYDKSETSYSNLCEILNRARRAHLIPMDVIRDDGFSLTSPWWYDDLDDFHRYVEGLAKGYEINRQAGQERRLLVWCEAAGMKPQLQRVGERYSVQVATCGGFDSTTAKHKVAKWFAEYPTTVLHIGDYDPSGVHMFGALDEDVRAFMEHYGGDVSFERLAVTPEQVERYELPTAPPKKSDNRFFEGTRTVQAEALDPRVLADIVRDAIESSLDMDLFQQMLDQEEDARQSLLEDYRG